MREHSLRLTKDGVVPPLVREPRADFVEDFFLNRTRVAAICLLASLFPIGLGAVAAQSKQPAGIGQEPKVTLFISCDSDCIWTIDNVRHGALKKGQEEQLDVSLGKHKLEAESSVELAPGNYEVRVVVSDGKKNFGRAEIPLQVEPFDGRQLMMSDIVFGGILRDPSWILRDAARIAPAPIVPTPLVSKNVEFFPSTDSNLPTFTNLSFYFEIYEPLLVKQPAEAFFSLRITDLTRGSIVMDTGAMTATKWIQPGNAVIPIGLRIPTGKLPIGNYKLEVQVSDSAGRRTPWQQASFIIK